MGCAGKLTDDSELHMTIDELKESFKQTHITGLQNCIKILSNYGFEFDGLKKGKVQGDTKITLRYLTNKNVPIVLHILSVKTRNTGKIKDFCRINYRLLKDNWTTADFGNDVDYMADLLSKKEQETAYLIHEEMLKRNYLFNIHDWNEGPQIRYYKNEKDRSRKVNSIFWLVSMKTELQLFFRIKDIETGLGMINNAPDSVIKNFLKSETGCWNRIGGLCKAGVGYSLKGVGVWRCGCTNPNFRVVPTKDDYMFYINLVETTQHKRVRK